ncbi:MAG: hypothetical protein AAFX87_27320 [Bacteroidota bacterium]
MKQFFIPIALILFYHHSAEAQQILDKLRDELPKTVEGLELANTPEIYGNGSDANLVANYNDDVDTYLNCTFTVYSDDIFNRLKKDLANAPKSFENDEMKIMALALNKRQGQVTFQKQDGKFEGSVLDEPNSMLITFTGAGITDKQKIKDILEKILSVL